MERISTAMIDRRPARRGPAWLATVLIVAISSLALNGQGEAAPDAVAPRAAPQLAPQAVPQVAPQAVPGASQVYRL